MPTYRYDASRKKYYENIMGKGENAGNQHFLPFPQCFLNLSKKNCTIWTTFELLSATHAPSESRLTFPKEQNFRLFQT